MTEARKNIILEKTLDFSIKIVAFTDKLIHLKKYSIADQLVRSGTSVGANVWESQGTSTPKEFVRCLKIALKEANETEYWLLVCQHSQSLPEDEALLSDVREIKLIIQKIVSTTQSRINLKKKDASPKENKSTKA